ncbi:hypothetical protein K504DRAFT_449824 [Pleomassaria siparia CBS 279.74]|uniref:Mid2 domain-containing protein n=1 Tax=Pleomassaria siparia CBS 279.74 TaxID=1314801 RepID=A0A6G1KJQ3_9PLEO|nr:hypothetical protein K504DRAFT_449824 [Pleomassaria siparia CBS 279.74]
MARLIILILSFFAGLAHADCFRPNGTTRNSLPGPPEYVPCSTSATSMCCRNGIDANGVPLGENTCRDDGLCQDGTKIWRESCSDKSWKSDACIKLCVSDTLMFEGLPQSQTDVIITECDNGSICCGDSAAGKPCCQQGKGVFLVGGKVFSTDPNAKSTAPTSSSSTATSIATSSASTPTNDAQSTGPTSSQSTASSSESTTGPASDTQRPPARDYTGVIAGCAVAGLLSLALLICLLWWLTFKKGKAARSSELDSSAYQSSDTTYKYAHTQALVYYEAPGAEISSELPGRNYAAEVK